MTAAPEQAPATYTLTVTADQLAMISRATELAARISIGQLGDVAFKFLLGRIPLDDFCRIRDGLQLIERDLQNVLHRQWQEDPSGATDTPRMDDHDCAWSLYHAARYRLYLDDCERTGEDQFESRSWTVLADPPTAHGRHLPPTVTRTEAPR